MFDATSDHPAVSIAMLRTDDPLRVFVPLQLALSGWEQEALRESYRAGPIRDQRFYAAQNADGIIWGAMGCPMARNGSRTVRVEPFAVVGYCDAQVRAIARVLLAHAERVGRKEGGRRLDLVVPDSLVHTLIPVLRARDYASSSDGRYAARL